MEHVVLGHEARDGPKAPGKVKTFAEPKALELMQKDLIKFKWDISLIIYKILLHHHMTLHNMI